MPRRKRVFYAYPSSPPALGETINNALTLLKGTPELKRDNVRFTPWPDLKIGGKQLVATILSNIDRSDVFACDLTYINSNVSFELGYAIGRFKRVWISLNTGIEGAVQRYRRVYFGFIGSGYIEYKNSHDLRTAFLDDNPLMDLDRTILGAVYKNPMARQETPTLLYVKPPVNTDAVITTTNVLNDSIFGNSLVVDDPIENPSPTLDWYAHKLGEADAILCHLLANDQKGELVHNTKCSIVAGVAKGLRKSMLMLAHSPYESPIDFQSLLRIHDTAGECGKLLKDWTLSLGADISPRQRAKARTKRGDSADLRSLVIGEPVAENENRRLDEYFVETSAYLRAMSDPVTIVVGRKGSGKSAQLYAMQSALSRDKRNHICVIKPVGYEVSGLVRVLKAIVNKSERGYLIESLWKYLVYSELARSVHATLMSRPSYVAPTPSETHFLRYFDERRSLLSRPFSERLDGTIKTLAALDPTNNAITQRARISELLHSNELRGMREALGQVLSEYERVDILIDNLDAPWGPNAHVGQLSELLWGLLLVSDDIVADFQKQDYWRTAVEVNLTVFLRSDIFAHVQSTASEQDKLPIQRIIWDDPRMLKRIIEQRLLIGSNQLVDANDIWSKLFPREVVGMSTWDFAISTVLPRPRDIVFLFRDVLDSAINLGQLEVSEYNFLNAREKYSEFVFRSILAEDDPEKGRLEALMYEFAGCGKRIRRRELEGIFGKAGVGSGDVEFYIDLLCDVNFLSIPTLRGYEYAKEESDRTTKRQIAAKIAANKGMEETFGVSSAFWHVLQVE